MEPGSSGAMADNRQLESAQAQVGEQVQVQVFHVFVQVQEVVGVMRNNIDRVLERDNKLNDLDYR